MSAIGLAGKARNAGSGAAALGRFAAIRLGNRGVRRAPC